MVRDFKKFFPIALLGALVVAAGSFFAVEAQAQQRFFTQSSTRGLQNAKLEARMSQAEADIDTNVTNITANTAQIDAVKSTSAACSADEKLYWTGAAWDCREETDPTVSAFAKSDLPTCTSGQVLAVTGSGASAAFSCVDNAGASIESDPTVQTWAKNTVDDCSATEILTKTGGDLVCTSGSTFLSTNETDPTVPNWSKAALPTCGVGQVLKANGSSLSCVNDIGGSGAAIALGGLSDVTLSGLASGQFLRYNGTNWYNGTEVDPNVQAFALTSNPLVTCEADELLTADGTELTCASITAAVGGSLVLDDISDVTITDASADEVLAWDGSKWVNAVETDPNVKGFAKDDLPTCASGSVLSGDGSDLSCVSVATIVGSSIGLNNLNDVNTSGVSGGKFLVYNGGTSRWEPGDEADPNVQGWAKSAVSNCGSGEMLSMVAGSLQCISSATNIDETLNLDQLADVTLGTVEDGDVLVYNQGTGVWVAGLPDAGDAETLDGLDSEQFLRSDADDTTSGTLTVGGGLVVDTNTLYVDRVNNRVGIKNTATDISGTVMDNLVVGTGSEHAGVVVNAGSSYSGGYTFANDGNARARIQFDHDADLLRIGVTALGGDDFTISNNGYVGIGTSTAGSRLSVAGAISATALTLSGNASAADPTLASHLTTKSYVDGLVGSTSAIQQDDTAVTVNDTGTGVVKVNVDGDDIFTFRNAGTTVDQGPVLFQDGSTGAPSIAFAADTDTGIFRSADNAMNFSFGGALGHTLRSDSSNSYVVARNNHLILRTERANAADDDIIFQGYRDTGTSEWMRIKGGSGYVGIGTASPVSALDVSGTVTAKVFSSVPGGFGEAFGLGATIDGNYALAVGRNAQTAMNSTTAIGHEASATQTNAVALGKGAGAHNIHSTALGTDTSVSGNYSTVVGSGATATNLSALAVGAGAQVSGNRASALGTGANASGAQSLAIGTNSNAAHDYSIVIAGRDGASTANQQFVVGSDTARITTAYIGRGVSSPTPSPGVTINATGGSGTDIAATDLVLAGGRATGNAAGGDVLFQTSDAGSSGNTLQSLTTKMAITAAGDVGIGTTEPTSKLDVDGTVTATAFAGDGSNLTNISAGSIGAAGSNKQVQFNDSGDIAGASNLYWDETNDRLGIGISDPTSPFHIGRSAVTTTPMMKITDTDTQSKAMILLELAAEPRIRFDNTANNDASPEWDIGLDGSDNFILRTRLNNANLFVMDHDGNTTISGDVAIGKTSASTALDVSGTVTATAFAGDGSQLTGVTADSVTISGTAKQLLFNSDGSTLDHADNLYWNQAADFLGIGTDSPISTLHLVHTINNGYADPVLTVDGSVGAGDYLLAVRGAGDPSTATYDNTIFSVVGDGRVGVRAIDPSATFHIVGKATGYPDNAFLVDGHGGTTDKLLEARGSGTSRFVVMGDGKVGIGAPAPAAELDVVGTVSATAFVGDGSQLTNIAAGAVGAAGSDKQIQFSDDGDMAGASNLYWDEANDRLGIGTSAPTGRLFVTGSGISSPGNASLYYGALAPLTVATQSYNILEMVTASNNPVHSAGPVSVRARGTLDSPTVPSEGDYVGGYAGAIWDGNSVNTTDTAKVVFKVDGSVSNEVAPQRIEFMTSETNASGLATRLVVKADGKVGIGTEDPAATLDVSGTIHATQICDEGGANCKDISGGWGSATNLVAGNTSVAVADTGSDGSITFTTEGAQRMVIDEVGNVGIGTATPDADAKLDVAGAIKVASNSNAEVCDEGMKGAIRFNSSTGKLQVCK